LPYSIPKVLWVSIIFAASGTGSARPRPSPTAHNLARLVYTMFKNGSPYVDAGQQYYERQYHARAVQNLKRKAQDLAFNWYRHELAAQQHRANNFDYLSPGYSRGMMNPTG